MKQLVIEFLAGLYDLAIYLAVPIWAGRRIYKLLGGDAEPIERDGYVARALGEAATVELEEKQERRAVIWGVAGGIAALLVTSFADFNMHAIVRVAHRRVSDD